MLFFNFWEEACPPSAGAAPPSPSPAAPPQDRSSQSVWLLGHSRCSYRSSFCKCSPVCTSPCLLSARGQLQWCFVPKTTRNKLCWGRGRAEHLSTDQRCFYLHPVPTLGKFMWFEFTVIPRITLRKLTMEKYLKDFQVWNFFSLLFFFLIILLQWNANAFS